jgi:hypothetical protein
MSKTFLLLVFLCACGGGDSESDGAGREAVCTKLNAFGMKPSIDLKYTVHEIEAGESYLTTCEVLASDTQEQLAIGQGSDNCSVDYDGGYIVTVVGATVTAEYINFDSEHDGESLEYDSCTETD